MDAIAGSGLEPQLAIPVIVVVLGALLVYIFGFQKTEEPSLEHLAVLNSSSAYKSKPVAANLPKTKTSASSNATSKASSKQSNGAIPGQEKATQAKKSKETKQVVSSKVSKKENVRDPANKPEDFETGDWIPAVSRKEKKSKKKDDVASSPTPGKKNRNQVEKDKEINKHVETSDAATKSSASTPSTEVEAAVAAAATTATKAPKIEDVLASMNLKQSNMTPSPSKKSAPEPGSDKKSTAENPANIIVTQNGVDTNDVEKEATKKDFKANIAFDEMGGDTWEEAKSRGAKKRRTVRRD